MEIKLQPKNAAEEKIKAYLERNASATLADKINNGVFIEKDGKKLLNRKTLNGFMRFAMDEAKKTVEKGVSSACIEDDVVYGWAIHYFEENSVEETLYQEDGTEYKKSVPAPVKTSYTPPKPAPKPQISFFDMMDKPVHAPVEEDPDDIVEDDLTEQEMQEFDYVDDKQWIDKKTYADQDGVVHHEEEDDDIRSFTNAYDKDALAIIDELFGSLITLE